MNILWTTAQNKYWKYEELFNSILLVYSSLVVTSCNLDLDFNLLSHTNPERVSQLWNEYGYFSLSTHTLIVINTIHGRKTFLYVRYGASRVSFNQAISLPNVVIIELIWIASYQDGKGFDGHTTIDFFRF